VSSSKLRLALEKLETPEERRWYAQKAIEHGWSRNVLVVSDRGERDKAHGRYAR
jgi:hypothetical protein